jgi:Flp pilus assembly protein CpaB
MKSNISLLLSNITNLILNWRKEVAWAFLISALLISANPLFTRIGTESVLIAKNDLVAGSQISHKDYEVIYIPRKFKAPNATDASSLSNLILISNVNKGEQLTLSRFISPNLSSQDLVPIRIADSQIAKVIQPGQLVDVVSSSDSSSVAKVLARKVKVIAIYPESQSFTNAQGLLILVAADSDESVNLAGSGNLKLSLVIRNQ